LSKKQDTIPLPKTLANVDRFSEFFLSPTYSAVMYNELMIKDLTAPQSCRYITL